MISIQISDSPSGLQLTLPGERTHLNKARGTWLEDSPPITISLQGKIESILTNTCIALRAGIASHRIAQHIQDHSAGEASCPCCKLEGRTLRGMGRKALSQEDRLRAASRASQSGTVQIRHFQTGLSGAQLVAKLRSDDQKRAARRSDFLPPVAKTKRSLSELI